MRFLLALFALIALAVGPLSAPVEAAVTADHCSGADMAGMGHDAPAKGGAAKVKGCCVVAVATVDAPGTSPALVVPRAELKAAALPSLSGTRADVEVPPPRV